MKYHVIASTLNLRESASTDSDILMQLDNGQIVETDEDPAGGWLHCTAQSGDQDVVGYCAQRFCVAEDVAPGSEPDDPATIDPTAPPAQLSVTLDRLKRLAPTGDATILSGLAAAFDQLAVQYELDSALRICHFLAQAAHESAGFRTLNEYGGPSYFARYDGRKDLGNTQPGDGDRFHGRGLFQLTGRANYVRYGQKIGQDLVGQPELAARPDISLQTALEYWKSRGLSQYADQDDIKTVTRRINGGYNGLAQREAFYRKARAIWG